jgi:SAM-dependent methyltransferase
VGCRICDGPEITRYTVREGLFGTEEEFAYFECGACGCVQALELPSDLGALYPPRYYSLSDPRPRVRSLRRRLAELWATEGRGGPLAALLHVHKPSPELRRLRALGIHKEDAILDVGSGKGHRVLALRESGYANAVGIDPYLDRDAVVAGHVVARKAPLADVAGSFRLVMFNHSLEHMPDQHVAMAHARRLVAADGVVLVRLPTVSSWAWEHYREQWASFDAPRHLFLHSRASVQVLAERHGLRVDHVYDESTEFQYWTSELRLRGMPVAREDGSLAAHPMFAKRQLSAYRRRARALNRTGRGDEIAVVLRVAAPA